MEQNSADEKKEHIHPYVFRLGGTLHQNNAGNSSPKHVIRGPHPPYPEKCLGGRFPRHLRLIFSQVLWLGVGVSSELSHQAGQVRLVAQQVRRHRAPRPWSPRGRPPLASSPGRGRTGGRTGAWGATGLGVMYVKIELRRQGSASPKATGSNSF